MMRKRSARRRRVVKDDPAPPKPAKRKVGKPAYQPNDKDRGVVFGCSLSGQTQDRIAALINVSPHTLRKYYRRELDDGMPLANAVVANRAYQNAIKDDPRFIASNIYWCKVHLGWRTTEIHQHAGAIGSYDIDMTKLTDEQLTQLDEVRSGIVVALGGPSDSRRDSEKGG